MTSQKPYLLRALYEWCSDNSFTPHIMVLVDGHTQVPQQYVRDNKIVLNINFDATKDLNIDNQWLTFQATFNGQIEDIAIPIANVLAIFAKENGLGMEFELENYTPPSSHPESHPTSTLKLVK